MRKCWRRVTSAPEEPQARVRVRKERDGREGEEEAVRERTGAVVVEAEEVASADSVVNEPRKVPVWPNSPVN